VAEGLSIHVRDGAGIATIMARRGAARDGIAAALGLRELPGGPCLVQSGGLQLVGTGPGVWLAVPEGAAPGWAEGLAEAVRPVGTSVAVPGSTTGETTVQPVNKSLRVKYRCGGCAAPVNVWGKPGLNLICGDCGKGFTAQD